MVAWMALASDERDHEREHEGNAHREALFAEQVQPAAEEEAVGTRGVHGLGGEEAEQHRAEQPADQVHADDVEGVVVAEAELERDGEEADAHP